ncbi:MAG TPA: BrnT family toxin [Rhodopila sp.]|nr:BrnT family toxin [Rhodopila sp.]
MGVYMAFDVRIGSFEWDEDKNLLNQDRHGVSFEEATAAFADPDRLIFPDTDHSEQEVRLFCLGRTMRGVLTVRFTHRAPLIRIIGAGYWRKGRRIYDDERQKRSLH